MFKKNTLFYAANIEPEMARMFKASDAGDSNTAENFKSRVLQMIENILSLNEVSSAGRKEWLTLKELILQYEKLDSFSRKIILSFGKPFSEKFMRELTIPR